MLRPAARAWLLSSRCQVPSLEAKIAVVQAGEETPPGSRICAPGKHCGPQLPRVKHCDWNRTLVVPSRPSRSQRWGRGVRPVHAGWAHSCPLPLSCFLFVCIFYTHPSPPCHTQSHPSSQSLAHRWRLLNAELKKSYRLQNLNAFAVSGISSSQPLTSYAYS